jgi:hypothetical protein
MYCVLIGDSLGGEEIVSVQQQLRSIFANVNWVVPLLPTLGIRIIKDFRHRVTQI